MSNGITPAEAAAVLGRIRTPKKAAASAANIRKAQVAAHNRPLRPCTCGQEPHKYPCPVYAREAQRRNRAKRANREN
jgi:hypothetical protein